MVASRAMFPPNPKCNAIFVLILCQFLDIRTVGIGYCDYHLVTSIYCDYLPALIRFSDGVNLIALGQVLDIVTTCQP